MISDLLTIVVKILIPDLPESSNISSSLTFINPFKFRSVASNKQVAHILVTNAVAEALSKISLLLQSCRSN